MFSSSSCIDPELPPLFASAMSPDPGCCAEDVPLILPLLFWSSSILVVVPPLDSRARRCPKLLLKRVIGAGLGEPDIEEGIVCSWASDTDFLWPRLVGGGMWLSSVKEPRTGRLPAIVRGELDNGDNTIGEADKTGALKGWNENEVLLPARLMLAPASAGRIF